MKNSILFLLLLTWSIGFSASYIDDAQIKGDSSVVLNKNTDLKEDLSFKPDLKQRYNTKDFEYIDDLEEPKPKKIKEPLLAPSGTSSFFGGFMSYIFPIILGIIIVLIILKTFLGSETGLWKYKNSTKKVADKLVYEDEDIHETDFDRHLKKAISENNYRLATRYYYLALLKKLSDKKSIAYHKDKTNTEYLFEIENKDIRNQFSEASYIYNYVWYGEFPIDSVSFNTVEKKYKSIFKSIN